MLLPARRKEANRNAKAIEANATESGLVLIGGEGWRRSLLGGIVDEAAAVVFTVMVKSVGGWSPVTEIGLGIEQVIVAGGPEHGMKATVPLKVVAIWSWKTALCPAETVCK